MNPSVVMPNSTSSDQEWISWHQSMRKKYGKKNANQLFAERWNARKPKSSNTGQLRDYMKDQGVVIDSGTLLGDIRDTGTGIMDKVGSVLPYIGGYGVALLIVPILLTSIVVWQAMKNPETTGKIIGTAAKAL